MKFPPFYKMISYYLIISALLIFFVALSLLLNLGNPTALLTILLLSCVVLYIYNSFIFLQKCLTNSKSLKLSFKKKIYITGWISIISSIYALAYSTNILSENNRTLDKWSGNMDPFKAVWSVGLLVGNLISLFAIITAPLLILHAFMTFKVLKNNKELFESLEENNN